jgi:uroporphyrin-III C-methyltransferase
VRAVRDAIALLLDTGQLPVRRHRAAGGVGRVALVGGGPGDPGLITVRGRRLLAEADAVVVDRLAPRELLGELDPAVEVVDVGKAPHGRGPTQEEISALLVDRARRGLRVVRLKGGDPFVLGRGGEEMLACARAGVPVEVVPGVSSAVAGPAAAGIPVTHRGIAADFAVVSGHLDPTGPGSTVDWQALADGPATLVLLMALDRLDAVAAELVKRGRPGRTPVAVVRRATLADQQVLVATLDTVATEVARTGLRPPAVVVVGEVVSVREQLAGID